MYHEDVRFKGNKEESTAKVEINYNFSKILKCWIILRVVSLQFPLQDHHVMG